MRKVVWLLLVVLVLAGCGSDGPYTPSELEVKLGIDLGWNRDRVHQAMAAAGFTAEEMDGHERYGGLPQGCGGCDYVNIDYSDEDAKVVFIVPTYISEQYDELYDGFYEALQEEYGSTGTGIMGCDSVAEPACRSETWNAEEYDILLITAPSENMVAILYYYWPAAH